MDRKIPGAAFGIVLDGELVYSGSYGLRNVQVEAPTAPDSIFRIASMTKSLTAMAIVKLRDAGKLRLEAVAADYIPELATLHYPTTDSTPITVRQLLTMTAGFPQDDPWADRQLHADEETFSAWIKSGISFSNPPGIAYEYSNYGYGLLGRIISNVSGTPFQRYISQNILQPLGMASSRFDLANVPAERFAVGYRREDEQWAEETPLADGAFGAMGGLFTTIPDWACYMTLLLSAFPPRDAPDNGPLRRSSLREMQQIGCFSELESVRPRPDTPLLTTASGYGYGLRVSYHSVLGYVVGHGGGLPGYGTYYALLPDRALGVVAFSNLTYMPLYIPVGAVLTLLVGSGERPARVVKSPAPVLEVRDELARLYLHWDDDLITALATASYFQDEPLEKRREQFQKMRADFGACLSLTELVAENALRGRWKMLCEQGSIDCTATLAPTMPPRLQELEMTLARTLSPAMRMLARKAVRLIQHWDRAEFRRLFAAHIKASTIVPQFAHIALDYGPLTIGQTVEGDGQHWAKIRLESDKGSLDLRFAIDLASRRISEIAFSKPDGAMVQL